MSDIETLRTSLRDLADTRNQHLGRNPDHKKTKDAELEYLIGAGQALAAIDHPLAQTATMWAFLKSTGRDPLRS